MGLADLDLNLLVALDALLTERNISRAASRVGVSQSAMSKSLQRARANFDDPLLIRLGRDYTLTPFAEQIAVSLHDVLVQLEGTIRQRPTFTPGKDSTQFRIACSDAAELLFIGPLLHRIAAEAPGVSVSVQALSGSLTGQLVEQGELDLALSSLRYYRGELCNEVLYTDRRVCAVWSELEVGESLSWEQILTLPHAGYNWPPHDPYEDVVVPDEMPERELAEQMDIRITDGNHLTRLLLLPGTDLVMFTFEKVALHVSEIADVKVVLPPFEPLEVPFGMLWHPRNTTEPAHQWLRDELKDLAKSMGE